MFCTKCGRELNPKDRFCPGCGAEVRKGGDGQGKYDNVVFNPPFRMEAEKKTAQIMQSREEFKGFSELAEENSRRNPRSKGNMDWNLDGLPESLMVNNSKSSFDWGAVVESKRNGRSYMSEPEDLTATMEHKKVSADMKGKEASAAKPAKPSMGLPPDDNRGISLEELEKELYDLEEELRTDTAKTAKYEPFRFEDVDKDDELDAYLDGIPKVKKEPETKAQEPEEELLKKKETPMRWNLDEDTKISRGQKAVSSMGLVWGIDPMEAASKKRAAKSAAQKETKMIWDLEAKEKEERAKAEAKAREAAERAEAERLEKERLEKERLEAERLEKERLERERLEAERLEKERLERERLEAERLEAERLEKERLEAERLEAERLEKERLEAERLEDERLEKERADAERRRAERLQAEKLAAEREKAAGRSAGEDDILGEYKDLIKNAEPDYLERTKVFVPSAAAGSGQEQPKGSGSVEEETSETSETAEEPKTPETSGVTENTGAHEAPHGFKKLLYQSDFRHPWDIIKKHGSDEKNSAEIADSTASQSIGLSDKDVSNEIDEIERSARQLVDSEEVGIKTAEASEAPLGGMPAEAEAQTSEEELKPEVPAKTEPAEAAPAAEAGTELAGSDMMSEGTEAPEEMSEEAPEEASEEAPEEMSEVAPQKASVEVSGEAPEGAGTAEEAAEDDMPEYSISADGHKSEFYTFNSKNEAFQKLLSEERKRLEAMGANYTPKNASAKVEVSRIETNDPNVKPAYEEGGRFVDSVVQPALPLTVDLSGDPKPNVGQFKYSFITDTDWLREMTSQNDLSSINKTKLRYSDLFPSPVTEESAEGTGSFREKTEEEKKEIAADINQIFDEDEAAKPKKHYIGNTIIILLILVILFEGSVLAAKLIAPDSAYSRLSDTVFEKVLNLFTGSGDSGDAALPEGTDTEDGDDSQTANPEKESDAAYYQGIVSSQSQTLPDVGEILYQEELNYGTIGDSAFEDLSKASDFKDKDWYEDENGIKVTYAESLFGAILDYYRNWQSWNSDEKRVGINRIEMGEIRQDGEKYYVLTRLTYASQEGGTETVTQTCCLTEKDKQMFLEEIKEETVNE